MKNRASLYALIACWLLQLGAGLLYYPKWNKPYTEATIGWDVSGYYMYLPAILIYRDIKQLGFKDEILNTYAPTPDFQQGFRHKSGNYVMKYTAGMAVMYLPAFLAAHGVAKICGYQADGFSTPYQLAINIWSLLVALLGVWMLRQILLRYFSDTVTAITLILIVFATNYLDYSAINTALSHNYLFTLYTLLIWLTIRFYESPTRWRAVGIGAVVGLAALTRPTELIAVIIPVLWGLRFPPWEGIRERVRFAWKHADKVVVAALVCGAIGSIQLIYWKAVGDDWLIYSYQEQEFSWLHPHLKDGLLSYNSGWLVYTPVMVFALLGFFALYRQQRQLLSATLAFSVVFIYVAVAWDIWWYGASLGNRAIVQAYPVLAIPLASFVTWVLKRPLARYVALPLGAIFLYYNFWLTHQAHKGGIYHAGQMTRDYFWKTLLDYKVNPDDRKLLDTPGEFLGQRQDVELLAATGFDDDSSFVLCGMTPIEGPGAAAVCADLQFTEEFSAPWHGGKDWIRATAQFKCAWREADVWRMTQFTVRFSSAGQVVKQNKIRIQRLLNENETREIFVDVRVPREPFDTVSVFLWNADGQKPLVMDNLRIEAFNE